MPGNIQIKGIRDGLLITLGEGSWPDVRDALLDHVQKQAQFLQGARLALDVGNHILRAAELGQLRDALSGSGEFLGGLILPGMESMRQSLMQDTAQLRGKVQAGMHAGELCAFPRNTADAIYSGALRATIGAIQQQYGLLAAQQEIRCIVSGGAAAVLLPHLGSGCERVDNLVLHGLQITGQEAGE